MLYMNHRPRSTAPMSQQLSHPVRGGRVVAPPEPGVMNAFLLIDQNQRRACLELHADFSPAGSLKFPHFNITSSCRQAIESKQDDLMPEFAVRRHPSPGELHDR